MEGNPTEALPHRTRRRFNVKEEMSSRQNAIYISESMLQNSRSDRYDFIRSIAEAYVEKSVESSMERSAAILLAAGYPANEDMSFPTSYINHNAFDAKMKLE